MIDPATDPSRYAPRLTAADLSGDVPDLMTAPAVGWGILGAGAIAATFAEGVQQRTNSRIAAVGSRDLAKAEQFVATHANGAVAHGNYRDLVADDSVDVVYVATPHSMHLEHAMLAIDAGKHLLVEKPIARSVAEAQVLIDAAAAAGVFCMEAMWTRFLPHVAALRAAIARGEIGEVRTIFADFDVVFPYDPAHRLYAPELAGGALLDIGIYPIAFAHDLMGMPTEFLVRGTTADTGVDDHVAMLLRWAKPDADPDLVNGDRHEVHALLHTSTRAAGPKAATIIGSTGHIVIPGEFFRPVGFTLTRADGSSWDFISPPGEGKAYEAAEVARRIAAGETTSPRHSPQDVRDVMSLLDQARAQLGVVYPGEAA